MDGMFTQNILHLSLVLFSCVMAIGCGGLLAGLVHPQYWQTTRGRILFTVTLIGLTLALLLVISTVSLYVTGPGA